MARTSTPLVARLGSTAFPVKLYRTVRAPEDTTFDKAGPHGGKLETHVLIAGSGGIPAQTELREEGHADAPVERDQIRQGVRLADDTFVDLTEHLERVDEEETMEEMEILAFIRREQLPLEAVQGSYWMAPGDPQSAKILKLIHAVGRARHRSAVVAWTKTKNRALGIIVPHASGAMLLCEIAFEEQTMEIPPEALSPAHVEVSDAELEAAIKLVEAMSENPNVLDEVQDDRRQRRAEIKDFVLEHGRAPKLPEREPEPVLEETATFLAAIS